MKKLLIGIMLCVSGLAYAQQESQYSMYMFNQLLINPAVTGTEDFSDIKVGYRDQWASITDHPRNFYGTFHTPLGKSKPDFEDVKPLAWHGVGGFATGEVAGIINKYKVYGSYAYHLPINTKMIFSLGTFLGLQNYYVNESKAKFSDNQPDLALSSNVSSISPDGSIGAWLYSRELYVGLSILQIFNNKVKVVDAGNAAGKLNRHYFFTAGYKIKLNETWAVVPSVLVKGLSPAPVQFDINAKVRYKDMIWAGLSYRNKDAAVILIGMTYDNRIDIGYAFDYSISKLNKYTYGSHEVLVGYHLPKKKLPPAHSYFW